MLYLKKEKIRLKKILLSEKKLIQAQAIYEICLLEKNFLKRESRIQKELAMFESLSVKEKEKENAHTRQGN